MLRRGGLADFGDEPDGEPLTGGVSSDIWLVRLTEQPVCVKRALAQLKVKADAVSIAPLETLEIVANGKVVESVKAGPDPHKLTLATTVDLPAGGWIAVRASGPSSRYISDSYAFAQSSPVYVVRNGRRFTSAAVMRSARWVSTSAMRVCRSLAPRASKASRAPSGSVDHTRAVAGSRGGEPGMAEP